MNQDQRKFLIAAVEKEGRKQQEDLKRQIPEKPSLNNYLIAAFLDNTIQFANIENLKQKMRDTVLKYGPSDKLICEHERYGSKREYADVVQVPASDLFVIPQNYLDALADYEKRRAEIQSKIDQLEATQNTIVMKIQIGSPASLEKLVMQIDSIGDLSLVNSTLQLGPSTTKRLGDNDE